ncbi:DUF6886 family protein [Streptomyces cyaneofuscatus]|uniref:DUF6886 family protein n=1 Tax=Streptomyces cyaneofuscatus TaxID=66883 RepID=UPI003F4BFA2C
MQLRVLVNLWDFSNAVTASTLGFGGIRLRDAPRCDRAAITSPEGSRGPSSTMQSRPTQSRCSPQEGCL